MDGVVESQIKHLRQYRDTQRPATQLFKPLYLQYPRLQAYFDLSSFLSTRP